MLDLASQLKNSKGVYWSVCKQRDLGVYATFEKVYKGVIIKRCICINKAKLHYFWFKDSSFV